MAVSHISGDALVTAVARISGFRGVRRAARMPTGNTVCVPCVLDREDVRLPICKRHYRSTIGIVYYAYSACNAASVTLPRVYRHCQLALLVNTFVTEPFRFFGCGRGDAAQGAQRTYPTRILSARSTRIPQDPPGSGHCACGCLQAATGYIYTYSTSRISS